MFDIIGEQGNAYRTGIVDILVSGMGIAGPTLAYWLLRGGHRPVIVEQAPALREGGYIIDFWGLGYDIAEKMGLLPSLRERAYFIEEVRLVGSDGRKVGGFSVDVFKRATNGRYMSLPRSDLAAAIYELIRNDVETLWGDSVAAIAEGPSAVSVMFEKSPPRSFDLVIGADGLHSQVRQLCFKGEPHAEMYLGYKVAAFEVDGYEPRDENVYVSYSKPGRQIARFSMREGRTLFLLVHRDSSRVLPPASQVKHLLHREFDGLGWESDRVMAVMDGVKELYFDRISQIRIPTWSRNRVVLVSDAAACPSLLAGEGAALGMAGAYILAGEINRAGNGTRAIDAFGRYETKLHPFLERKQESARRFASSFAPATNFGIALRNLVTRAFAIPLVADLFLGSTLKDDFDLPDYG